MCRELEGHDYFGVSRKEYRVDILGSLLCFEGKLCS